MKAALLARKMAGVGTSMVLTRRSIWIGSPLN